jgi:hypothetical protein
VNITKNYGFILIIIICSVALLSVVAGSTSASSSAMISTSGTVSYSSTPTPSPTATPTPTPSPTPTPTQSPGRGGGGGGSTPTPTPTPPSGPNLASMPPATFWSVTDSSGWGWGNSLTTGYLDYPVSYGGQSDVLEMLPNNPQYTGGATSVANQGYCGCEEDGPWTPISPGDTLYFSAWIWISPSTCGETSLAGIIGCDAYNGKRICEIDNVNGVGTPDITNGVYLSSSAVTMLPWGTGGWKQLSFTWTVPSTLEADGCGGNSYGTMQTPSAFIPWIGLEVFRTGESGTMWVYGTVITISK